MSTWEAATILYNQEYPNKLVTSIKACKICLAVDLKMFDIRKGKLAKAYMELFNMFVSEDFVSMVCWECAHRLISFEKFKTKVIKSRNILGEMLKKYQEITIEQIASIDRKQNGLTSTLSCHYLPTNDFVPIFNEEVIKTEHFNETNGPSDMTDYNFMEDDLQSIEKVDNGIKSENDVHNSSEDEVLIKKVNRSKLKNKNVKKRIKADPSAVERYRKTKHLIRRHRQNRSIETKFVVRILSNEEQVAELKERSRSEAYQNSSFKCNLCFRGYNNKELFDSHMTRHSPKCGPYECYICKYRSKSKTALKKHLTGLHSREFKCKECGFVAKSRGVANQHLKWHMGTTYQCSKCFAVFSKMTTYMSHRRLVHASDSVCELCGYTFVNDKGVLFHKKLAHRDTDLKVPEDGPYCEQCNVRFASNEAYDRHLGVSSRHVTDNTRICNDSTRRRSTFRKVKRRPDRMCQELRRRDHKEVKTWPKPCELCDVPICDQMSYNKHFKREHRGENRTVYSSNTPSLCEHCGKMFAHVTVLKDHMWVHTGVKQVKCDICHKEFRNKGYLTIHQGVHSADRRKFDCQICGMSFTQAGNRSRHMTTAHSGVKQYKCDVCQKTFTTKKAQYDHVDHVHLKKPWPKRVRPPRRKNAQ